MLGLCPLSAGDLKYTNNMFLVLMGLSFWGIWEFKSTQLGNFILHDKKLPSGLNFEPFFQIHFCLGFIVILKNFFLVGSIDNYQNNNQGFCLRQLFQNRSLVTSIEAIDDLFYYCLNVIFLTIFYSEKTIPTIS